MSLEQDILNGLRDMDTYLENALRHLADINRELLAIRRILQTLEERSRPASVVLAVQEAWETVVGKWAQGFYPEEKED